MRNFICVVLLVLFITLAVGSTALAEPGNLMYRKQYDINGIILMKIQAGSDYDQSGQYKSLVRGVGHLTREDFIVMSSDGLIAETDNLWVADPESLRGLEVAGTFRLHDQYVDTISEKNSADESPASVVYSPQMFATSVDAERGESGELAQSFTVDSSGKSSVFAINQHTETSGGTVLRYIDITDPASGAYLFEDSEIVGEVSITEWLNSNEPGEDFVIATASAMDDMKLEQGEHEAGELFPEAGSQTKILDEKSEGENNEKPALVIDGAEIFKSVVPLGTEIDQLGLDEEIIFQSDLITIKEIYVEWDDQFFSEYDPHQEGSYTFAGELIFPETAASDESVYIFHVVHVVEDPEEFASDHFEDPVHGGENGENQDTDKSTDR